MTSNRDADTSVSSTPATIPSAIPSGTPVLLNIYDLLAPDNPEALPTVNSYLYYTGLGLYHSGVQIQDTEYAFGGHMYSYTGLFQVKPRTAPEARFRQSVVVGYTKLDDLEIARLMASMAEEWPGNKYNLLTRNCNDFADELCRKLTGEGAPAWINRLAWIGQRFKFMLPQGFDTPMAAPVVPEKNDQGIQFQETSKRQQQSR